MGRAENDCKGRSFERAPGLPSRLLTAFLKIWTGAPFFLHSKGQKELESPIKERPKTLKKFEDRYVKIFRNLKDALYVTDTKGKFIYMNPAGFDLLGYSEAEIINMNLADFFIHSHERNQFKKNSMLDKTVKDFEAKLRKKDGAAIDCLITADRVGNGSKNLVEYQGIIRNITPNKRATDTIREQEKFLKLALDALSHPFLVIDVDDYTVKIANKAAYIFGVPENITCFKLTHGSTQPCSQENSDCHCPLEQVVSTRKPARLEHAHLDKNGNVRYFEIHAYPVFDNSGRVTQMLEYTLDITEETEAKRELRLLGTAVEQSADSIIITDPAGVIQYSNPAFEAAYNYSKDEIIGQKDSIFKKERNHTGFYRKIADTIKCGNSWNGHIKHKRMDGTPFEEEVTISPVKDKNGEIRNYVVTRKDVTERKRLEAIAEATNLMDKLGYIFSGIRHEIGNPVNSIKMALAVLSKNLDTYSRDKVEEFVKRALDDVSRIEYLLLALKNFSMFERPEIRKVRLDEFIQRFISLAKNDTEKKGIRIETDQPCETIFGYTDSRALHQVMLNLLTNAVDALYGRSDPQISINLNPVPNLVQIRMIDNGRGLTEEERQNLFKPFFTSKAHGTGLGLVIVKKMLASMNSSINIESIYDKGTTVTISIPECRLEY